MKKKLTIALSTILPLLLIGAGAGIYFGFFTPNAQAKRISNSVMHAASSQHKEAFTAYGAPENSDSFYTLAGQRNYRFESLAHEENTIYTLYAFTDTGSPAKARIGVENGAVTSLTTGNKLGATPSQDSDETTQTDSGSQHCLTRDDLAHLDSTRLYAKTFRGATMIFENTTSTEYAGEENGKKLLDRMANFYDKSHTKDYSLLIRGYLAATPDSIEERRQVIQNRATRIQQELVERGISDDRISIGEPVAYPADQPTTGEDERYIIIDVVNNCIK